VLRYTLRRFGYMIITLWVIITLTFFLMHMLPGDPFSDIQKLTPELQAKLLEKYGLDKPLPEQYLHYLGKVIQGDLGVSYKSSNQEVTAIIKRAFPVSAQIGLQAIALGVLLGLTLGIFAAIKQGTAIDYLAILVAIIGVSVPSFVIAALLQYFIGVKLELLPVALWGTWQHTVMPSFALSLGMTAYFARMMRASMLDVINQDYTRTAKAKGLSYFQIIWRHTMRNAMLPIITILGPLVVGIITGTIVIERIFAIPGLGKYYVESIYKNDYSITLGLTIFYSSMLVVAIFVVDLLYGIVDPRIRIGGRK